MTIFQRATFWLASKSTWHKENKQMSIDNLLAPSKFGRWYEQGASDVISDDEADKRGLPRGKTPEQIKAETRRRQDEATRKLMQEQEEDAA